MTTSKMSNIFTNTTKAAIDEISALLNDVEKDEAMYCGIIESNRQRLCDQYGIVVAFLVYYQFNQQIPLRQK